MAILNGRIDGALLTSIPWSPGYEMRSGAVASLMDLSSRYRARFGVNLPIVSTYRSWDEQIQIFTSRYTRSVLVNRPFQTWNGQRWFQLPGTAIAAVPGTSNHGLAIAVDLGAPAGSWGTTQQAWLRANAGPAWIFEVPSEPWHIRFTGNADAPIPPVPPNPPIPPVPPQEDIMASLADLQAAVAPIAAQVAQVEVSVLEVSRRVDADRRIPATYALVGGRAVWLVHEGVGREHLNVDAYTSMGSPRILPVSPTNPLWALEILGDVGELYRKAGDPTGAAFLLATGGIRHIDAAEYAAIGSPLITDLPAEHPIWALPVLP